MSATNGSNVGPVPSGHNLLYVYASRCPICGDPQSTTAPTSGERVARYLKHMNWRHSVEHKTRERRKIAEQMQRDEKWLALA